MIEHGHVHALAERTFKRDELAETVGCDRAFPRRKTFGAVTCFGIGNGIPGNAAVDIKIRIARQAKKLHKGVFLAGKFVYAVHRPNICLCGLIFIAHRLPRCIFHTVDGNAVRRDEIIGRIVRNGEIVLFPVPADAVAADRPAVRKPPLIAVSARRGRGIAVVCRSKILAEITELLPVGGDRIIKHLYDLIPREIFRCGKRRRIARKVTGRILRVAVRRKVGAVFRIVDVEFLFGNGDNMDAPPFKIVDIIIQHKRIAAERHTVKRFPFADDRLVAARAYRHAEAVGHIVRNGILCIIARIGLVIVGQIEEQPVQRVGTEYFVADHNDIGGIAARDLRTSARGDARFAAAHDIYAVLCALFFVVCLYKFPIDGLRFQPTVVPERDLLASCRRTVVTACSHPEKCGKAHHESRHRRPNFYALFHHLFLLSDLPAMPEGDRLPFRSAG